MTSRLMVGRSVQVNSLCFTKADWQQNLANGAKANLLVFTPDAKENGNEGTKAYIENGEQPSSFVVIISLPIAAMWL